MRGFPALCAAVAAILFAFAPLATAAEAPFQPTAQTISFLGGATDVRAGDIDKDGDIDLLVYADNPKKLVWLRNNDGAGGSWTEMPILSNLTIHDFHLQDMDRDGWLDVVFSASLGANHQIAWMENPKDFAFNWTYSLIDSGVSFHEFKVVDIDQDSDSDVVAIGEDRTKVFVLRNNDPSSALIWARGTVAQNLAGLRSLGVADMDKDGDLDVVSCSSTAGAVYSHRNNNFAGSQWTTSVIDGDVDGADFLMLFDGDQDGRTDILLAEPGNLRLLFFQNKNTFLRNTSFQFFANVKYGSMGDVDLDGDLDVMYTASSDESTVSWLENEGIPSQSSRISITGDYNGTLGGVALGDMDGDGDLDAFYTSYTEGRVLLRRNLKIHRNAEFPEEAVQNLGEQNVSQPLQVADMDGDGDLDIVAFRGQSIAVSENQLSTNDGWNERYVGGSDIEDNYRGSALALADLDRDGDMDIITAVVSNLQKAERGISGNEVHVLRNDGNFAFARVSTNPLSNAGETYALAAGDLNQDGLVDVVCGGPGGVRILWNPGHVTSAWTSQLIEEPAGEINDILIADFDSNGNLDVAVGGSSGGARILTNPNGDRAPTWGSFSMTAIGEIASMSCGDIDRDGDLDLVVSVPVGGVPEDRGSNLRTITIFFNNRTNQNEGWPMKVVDYVNADDVKLVDLDNDGDLDIINVRGSSGDKNRGGKGNGGIAFHENLDGKGLSWNDVFFSLHESDDVDMGDFDGDGDLDLVVSSNDLYVFPNMGGQYRMFGISRALPFLEQGQPALLYEFTGRHLGRAGDGSVQPNPIEMRFEFGKRGTAGLPEGLIERIQIFRDMGSNVPEPGRYVLVLDLEDPQVDPDGGIYFYMDPTIPQSRLAFGDGSVRFYLVAVVAPDAFEVLHPNTNLARLRYIPNGPEGFETKRLNITIYQRAYSPNTESDVLKFSHLYDRVDSDGDGFSDGIEDFVGTDPNDPQESPDFGDWNGDHQSNLVDALALYRGGWNGLYDLMLDGNLDGKIDRRDFHVVYRWLTGDPQFRIVPVPPYDSPGF